MSCLETRLPTGVSGPRGALPGRPLKDGPSGPPPHLFRRSTEGHRPVGTLVGPGPSDGFLPSHPRPRSVVVGSRLVDDSTWATGEPRRLYRPPCSVGQMSPPVTSCPSVQWGPGRVVWVTGGEVWSLRAERPE